MHKRIIIVIIFSLVAFLRCEANSTMIVSPGNTTLSRDTLTDSLRVAATENHNLPEETFRKKKFITCVLAFPVPFGFVGLHRIYLGSEPWVPIVYLCTAGGGFGLLPLIDFLYLVTADEEEFKKYENNPKVFMFVE